MEKILKNPTYTNKEGYNGLDLSHVVDFTSSVGQIVPVMWDFLQPGDKIRLQDSLLTRTSPLLSSAFCTIEENVRYFFVPISQIYKPFEQVYTGIQDFGSDFYSPVLTTSMASSDFLPKIQLSKILEFIQGGSSPQDIIRLMEGIGVPVSRIISLSDSEDTSYLTHQINLLPFLAYQKIWFDYFRDTDRIANDPACYNMDSFVDSAKIQNPNSYSSILNKIFTPRYCPVFKDIQNNIFVSPLMGTSASSIGALGVDTLTRVNNWLTASDVILRNSSNGSDTELPTQIGATSVASTSITTASLRSMFATEKLLEIVRRSGKHYDAQILARFGVDVPTGVSGECFELGKHVQNLEIGTVLSTSDTYNDDTKTGANLGEIGGKGYQHDTSNQFTFEAKTHGIVMAVYYARPHYVYEQDGIDKKLAYTRVSDFPKPEFENVGMQPVFWLNQMLTPSSSSNSNISGWQYRYSEVKASYDRLFAGMKRTLKNWVVSRIPTYQTADFFYCSPYDLNQILVVPYIPVEVGSLPSPAAALREANQSFFDTDPLLHQLSLSYQKATKLSTYGISKL